MTEATRRRAAKRPADDMIYEYDHNAVRVPERQPAPSHRPARVPQKLPRVAPQTLPEQKPRRRISFLYIAALVIGVVLFGNIISMRGQLTALAVKTHELKTGITSMEKEQSALKLALNEKMTQVEIEEYAVDTLGMVKADSASISYLRYHNDEVYEIADGNAGDNGIADVLWERLKNGAMKIWSFIN